MQTRRNLTRGVPSDVVGHQPEMPPSPRRPRRCRHSITRSLKWASIKVMIRTWKLGETWPEEVSSEAKWCGRGPYLGCHRRPNGQTRTTAWSLISAKMYIFYMYKFYTIHLYSDKPMPFVSLNLFYLCYRPQRSQGELKNAFRKKSAPKMIFRASGIIAALLTDCRVEILRGLRVSMRP